jgi:hypothetical protein
VGGERRKKDVATRENRGMGVKNVSDCKKRAPNYRKNLRVRVSNGPNGLERSWPKSQNRLH